MAATGSVTQANTTGSTGSASTPSSGSGSTTTDSVARVAGQTFHASQHSTNDWYVRSGTQNSSGG